MKKCKIAHITTIDMSLRYLLLNQLLALKQAGYDVVGISTAGEHVAVINSAGIRHLEVPMSRNISPLADVASIWRLYRLLRKEKFVLVHTHTPKPGLLGQFAAWMAGVPIIINTVHGYYFHEYMSRSMQRFYIFIEKFSAQFSSLVFFVNQEDMDTAVREGICSASKMKRLGPGGIGVNVQRFDRRNISPDMQESRRMALGLPENAQVVGFVGRLVAEKGVLELLQAARSIREKIPEVRFLFIGPVDQEKSDFITPDSAAAYDVADICIFTGERNDIPELMSLMNVLVLPSHREGYPVVPMEASAMALPCVVTDVRGCREAVENGRNGLIVPLHDVQALADAVVQLLTDEEMARRMGREGRKMAEERFDEQLVFRNVEREYARLLQEKGLQTAAPDMVEVI